MTARDGRNARKSYHHVAKGRTERERARKYPYALSAAKLAPMHGDAPLNKNGAWAQKTRYNLT